MRGRLRGQDLLLGLLLLVLSTPRAHAQKYAPIVGGWHLEIDLQGMQLLDFETDGEGSYGRGTGRFRLTDRDGGSWEFPAAWDNRDPQRISIAGDLVLSLQGKSESGTLVLRVTLVPGHALSGDALFIDSSLGTLRGRFVMRRTLAPEDLLSRSGHS